MKQQIQDWTLIIIMLLALPFIWLKSKLTDDTQYYLCEHGVKGNDHWFLLKTCGQCRLDYAYHLMDYGMKADQTYLNEHKKKCVERYTKESVTPNYMINKQVTNSW